MPHTLQEFLADATIEAAAELEKALLSLPEEKRSWKPAETSRSALNQAAECAIMNGSTIDMLRTGIFPDEAAHTYYQEQIARLAEDWPTVQTLLHENAARVADLIRGVPDADLTKQIKTHWGSIPMTEEISYPYWNMTYHTAQINYIASLLGSAE